MTQRTLLPGIVAALAITAGSATASAQDTAPATTTTESSNMALGIETFITGDLIPGVGNVAATGLPTFTWDANTFHIDASLLFASVDNAGDILGLGGKAYFRVHRGSRSGFFVGGGLLLVNVNPDVGNGGTDIHLEVSAKIRAWLTPNVAVHTTVGIGAVIGDNDNNTPDVIGLGGRLLATVGISYHFK